MKKFLAVVAAVIVAAVVAPASATAATGITWCDYGHNSMDILGDSGSTGYGTTGYTATDNRYQATTYGWVPRAMVLLGNVTTMRDYAHGGALVSDYLPGGRWADTVGAVSKVGTDQPSALLIELGGNEFYIDQDPMIYKSNLQALVNNVKSASPRSTIMLSHIWELGSRQSASPVHTWGEYGTAMRDTAVANGIGYIDLAQYMPSAALTSGQAPVPSIYGADAIHPNDAGNLIEAAVYFDFFNRC